MTPPRSGARTGTAVAMAPTPARVVLRALTFCA